MKENTRKFIKKEFEIEPKIPKVIEEMYINRDWTDGRFYDEAREELDNEIRRLCYERD